MTKAEFYRDARSDTPGPLAGVTRSGGDHDVNTYGQVACDPHVFERDMLQPTPLEDGSTAPITGPAAKFSRTPTRVRTGAPTLGQHDEEILAEYPRPERRRRIDEDVRP